MNVIDVRCYVCEVKKSIQRHNVLIQMLECGNKCNRCCLMNVIDVVGGVGMNGVKIK